MGPYGSTSVLKVPDLIVYGDNTVDTLGDYVKKYGNRAVLIYGGTSLAKSGNYERVMKILKKNSIDVSEISGITHDPDEITVKDVVEKVNGFRTDVILGIGGGSVMDTAKAASIIATNGGEVSAYWEGKSFTRPSIPFIALPTTSGTGTEVTKNAVITSRDKSFKKSIRSEYMIPDIALVDPTLTYGAPPDVTATTGLDALIQNLEGYTSKNAGPITDTFARKGIELAGEYLLRVVRNPEDTEAREGMSLASLYGGITLFNAGLGLAHGLSHPIGIRFDIPHGKACAITLPMVMEMNYSARRERYDETGMLLAGKTNGVDAVHWLLEELGVSTKLGDYGIRKEDIPRIVAESKGGSRNYNPVSHDDETVARMLEKML
jgi:alcohol dehydrogenase class IV